MAWQNGLTWMRKWLRIFLVAKEKPHTPSNERRNQETEKHKFLRRIIDTMSNMNESPFEEVSQTERENVEKSKTLNGDQIRNYIQCYELLYSLNEHIGNQSTTKALFGWYARYDEGS